MNYILKKTTSIFTLLLLAIVSYAQVPNFDNDIVLPPSASGISTYGAGATCTGVSASFNSKYNTLAYHVPDAGTPIKTIKVNFNVFQDASGGNNWPNNAATLATFNQMIGWINQSMANVGQPSDLVPGLTVPFIGDCKIRIELSHVYFYQNTALNVSGNASQLLNQINTTDPSRMNELNICLTNGSSGGASGYAYTPSFTNFNYDQVIVNFGSWQNGATSPWATMGNLHHELYHTLDLLHMYAGSCCPETCVQTSVNYLDDVFGIGATAICSQQGGWGCDPYAAGNTCSNNVMSGINGANYISPKQMGKMHRALALSSLRRYVKDCAYSTTPKLITSNETWDFDIKFYSDIIVEAGAVLTLQCKVLMPNQAKIIVKPGGKLVIDGGTITNGCDLMWQGIEVWGNQGLAQGNATQGWLVMQNNAIVENAYNGVQLTKVGTINTNNGGVIKAYNSTFKNNKRSVVFEKFVSNANTANVSTFENCNFIATAALRDPIFTDANGRRYGTTDFIVMNEVIGVTVYGCTFENSGVFDVDLRGNGITSVDANYNVSSLGAGTSIDKTEFKNLTAGIKASTTVSLLTNIYVSNSAFINTQQGIQGNIKFTVYNNTFTIPGFVTNPSNLKQWGIYVDGAKGIDINNNTFTGLSLTQSYGVISKNSTSFGGKIAFNTFTGLNFATQTEGDNPALQISCNTYTNDTKAWSLNPLTPNGTFADQGTAYTIAIPGKRANNTFNDACVPTGKHIHSYLNYTPKYYYTFSTTSPNPLKPTCNIGNIGAVSVSVNPDLSCVQPPPCVAPCSGGNRVKMQNETNPILKNILMNEVISNYVTEGNMPDMLSMLATFNTDHTNKMLVAENVSTNNVAAAKTALSTISTKGKENKNFVAYYNLAIAQAEQGKTSADVTLAQAKVLTAIATSNTGVANNASALLAVVNNEAIVRNPEFNANDADKLESIETVTATETIANTSKASVLYANVPNPFTNATSIRAAVANEAVQPMLKITTVLGKTIQVVQLNKGENTVEVTNANLTPGLYFYYLIENNKIVATRKMVVNN
jgi:hypothetical protein